MSRAGQAVGVGLGEGSHDRRTAEGGEHLFVLLDEPAKAKDCLEAILRLSWCVGVGRSAGWLGLAKDGDPLVYGPCDVTVGSPERLVYEGEISLGKGLERLPRKSTVIGGSWRAVCGRVDSRSPTSMRP